MTQGVDQKQSNPYNHRMWTITIHRDAKKSIRKLPKHVGEVLTVWQNTVRLQGPEGLMSVNGFNDEALQGVWKGCRSSRLSGQYRVIYETKADVVTVLVLRVTAHDYRRK